MAIYCLEDDSNIRELMVYTLDLAGFEVADTGIGIPESDYDRIFERFYRVEKSRTQDAGGTGLGLAITKELVSQMGGTFEISSEEGSGTTIYIMIPCHASVIKRKKTA